MMFIAQCLWLYAREVPAKFPRLGLWSHRVVVVGFGGLSAYFGHKTLAASAKRLDSDFSKVAKVIVNDCGALYSR